MNAIVSKPKATLLDLDALMDTKLSAVETLPDFMNPPAGIFLFSCKDAGIKKYKVKDENKKETGEEGNRISLTWVVEETLSLADEGELSVPDGTLFSEGFQGTEEGLKYFKKRAMGALNETDFGDASLGDIFGAMKDVQRVKVKVTIRKSKGDNGTVYENVNLQFIHEAA